MSAHRVLLIGDPVAGSVSPVMQRAAFIAAGLDGWTYDVLRVARAELQEAWRGILRLGGSDEGHAPAVAGLNVTIPLKEAVIPLMDEMRPEASIAGSVNTVTFDGSGRAVGDSTDGAGFLAALARVDERPPRRAVVLGTGGGARAVAACLRTAGADVLVLGRNADAGLSLAADLDVAFEPWIPSERSALRRGLDGADLLANATPIGSIGSGSDTSPLPEDVPLDPTTTVFDLVYRPRRTALLERAAHAGCRIVEGIEMLIEQGARSFERWTGSPAPVGVMREAAYRAMDAHEDR